MDNQAWEKICNNCGWCCLIKIQDEDTEELCYTKVICKYFDLETSKCTEYNNRCSLVPECLKLTPENVAQIPWMPDCCAYRKLLSQTPEKRPNANTFCISELEVDEEDLEEYVIPY